MPAWEQRKLGELVTTTIGGSTSTSNRRTGMVKYNLIQSSNVLEDTLFDVDIPKAITQKGLEESAAQIVPETLSPSLLMSASESYLPAIPVFNESRFHLVMWAKRRCAIYLLCAMEKASRRPSLSFRALRLKESPKKTCSRRIYQCLVLKSRHRLAFYSRNSITLITLHQRKRLWFAK